MAAPTNAAKRAKALANPEPSTHGTKRTRFSGLTISGIEWQSRPPGWVSGVLSLTQLGHWLYPQEITPVLAQSNIERILREHGSFLGSRFNSQRGHKA